MSARGLIEVVLDYQICPCATDSNGQISRKKKQQFFHLENPPGPPSQFILRKPVSLFRVEVFAFLYILGILAGFYPLAACERHPLSRIHFAFSQFEQFTHFLQRKA